MTYEAIPENEQFNITVTGDFNPAIFHPSWFIHEKFTKTEPHQVRFVAAQVAELVISNVRLTCIQNRLSIDALNMAYAEIAVDLGSFIFERLPHTPPSRMRN